MEEENKDSLIEVLVQDANFPVLTGREISYKAFRRNKEKIIEPVLESKSVEKARRVWDGEKVDDLDSEITSRKSSMEKVADILNFWS